MRIDCETTKIAPLRTLILLDPTIHQIDQLIRRDPARRGLIASEAERGPLCAGHLKQAAEHIARHGRSVMIATGFFVPDAEPPAAETDGPLGSLTLAAALERLGIETRIVTDENCENAVRCAAQAFTFPKDRIVVAPHNVDGWFDEFFDTPEGRDLTHLIAVERAGPNHTGESLQKQRDCSPENLSDFLAHVPAADQGRCYNMRGELIDEFTGKLHRLFQDGPDRCPNVKTIGVGDGGNEIGMGNILWDDLRQRLDCSWAARIPCCIGTDWTIIAGTSNWGAYGLAAAVALLRRRVDVLADFGPEQQQRVLQHMVVHGPAVDGITRRFEPTVDGLPFLTYIQPWEGIRRLLEVGDETAAKVR